MRPAAILVSVIVLMMSSSALTRTWQISPDGSGDAATIQAGIDSAAIGDTVALANGIYTGEGNREIDCLGKAVVIKSESENPGLCVIDLDNTAHRGFSFMSGEGPETILEGITITSGYRGLGGYGGGILCSGSSPTIVNVILSWNRASGGGGMACLGAACPSLEGVVFTRNVAEGLSGGGLLCNGSSCPSLSNVTFVSNDAGYMGVGGGMSCTDSSAASLSHVTFQENFGDGGGGGMYCSDSSPNLTNVTFLDNESVGSGPGIGGGAILCVNSSMPVLQDCTFSGNGAMDSGGGMWCKEGSDATLLRALFYGNGAQYGGALNCDESSPTVTNCTFSGNEAVVAGGAIFCYEASPVINRTILAFSVQGEGLYCYDAQSSPTLTCCDVLGNAGGDWVGCIASQYGTDGNISEDPLFCNTAGGDFSLEDCSPCLPGNHPDGYDCGGVIGAYGSGCGCGSAAEPTTWGAIKRMYRCPESQ